jgi:hypothetical protein
MDSLSTLSAMTRLALLGSTAIAGSRASALIFLLSFGIGTIVSGSLFSALAGHVLHTAARVSPRLHRIAIALAGVASLGVGVR